MEGHDTIFSPGVFVLKGKLLKKENIEKVYSGKSRAKAVKLYCHECNGFDGHKKEGKPTVSYQTAGYAVIRCDVTDCPLHPYRM